MTTDAILKELAHLSSNTLDIIDFFDEANTFLNSDYITEAQYNKVSERLRLELLDVERFIEVNECKAVSDPRAFVRDGIPSDKGLLSNEIFGTTTVDRANIFAFIELNDWFLDPSCYKAWKTLDSNIPKIVHGIDYYRLNDRGEIVQDPQGETGLSFLKKNINKIKFKSTESIRRDIKIQYLEANRNKMFIKRMMVIPPYYRDKNTGADKTVGLGGVNKLYNNLIIAANALTATQDYLFEASEAMRGRVQELMLTIYDWFCGNNNKNISKNEAGRGLSSKLGLIRMAGISKTSDFSSRLVLTASELKVERPEDTLVDFKHSAIPLAAAIAQFRDFVLFHVRRFFDNEFLKSETYQLLDGKGQVQYLRVENPEIQFSDEKIKYEMERFLHGYNNRFIPVEIKFENTEEKYYMMFKGSNVDPAKAKDNPDSIYHRKLTWCDVFYIATEEATRNKMVLITRFPIDAYTNQITTGIRLSSTKETEPIYIMDNYYPHYPKIRQEDLGTDTSNKFVDSIQISNLYLKGMGADFDGDQVSCKGVYTEEANEELHQFVSDKQNLISFGCKPNKVIPDECAQGLYAMTYIPSNVESVVKNNIEFA